MKNDPSTIIRLIEHRRGPKSAVVVLGGRREAYMGEAIALRARLAQRLDELQRRLATYHTFDEPGAGEAADRIAAVALAIEEIDALMREEASA